jgi:competence protein ComFC
MNPLVKSTWRSFPSKVYSGFWMTLDWLFPPTCFNCGMEGYRICPQCQKSFEKSNATICTICGRRVRSKGVCYQCRIKRPEFDQLRSLYDYKGAVREAIHRLKYQNDIGLAEKLADQLIDFYRTLGWQVDMIIPMPLFENRQIERGYNQSALLATPMSLQLGIKNRSDVLIRIKDTKSQVGLSESERWKNVSDAFVANPKIVNNKSILIIDDVTTTGATMNSAALAARKAGAKSIYCLTFARAFRGFDKTTQI